MEDALDRPCIGAAQGDPPYWASCERSVPRRRGAVNRIDDLELGHDLAEAWRRRLDRRFDSIGRAPARSGTERTLDGILLEPDRAGKKSLRERTHARWTGLPPRQLSP